MNNQERRQEIENILEVNNVITNHDLFMAKIPLEQEDSTMEKFYEYSMFLQTLFNYSEDNDLPTLISGIRKFGLPISSAPFRDNALWKTLKK